jgi:hypothetical protein
VRLSGALTRGVLAAVVLSGLALAGQGPARAVPPAAPAAGDDGALVAMAAIAGAGIEVRHALQVPGPDPAIALMLRTPGATATPGPAPGGQPAAAGAISARIVGGWHSGASGPTAANGSFGGWRGKALQIIGTWADTSASVQGSGDSVDALDGWSGDVDIAVGGLVSGESWSAAASGAYLSRWTSAVRHIREKRAGKGTTYIRFAHEMTGDWMPWSVNSSNVGAFKTAWRMYFAMVRREFPEAKLVFSPNEGNHSGVPFDQVWPGDDVVDVVGPDVYDGYPNKSSKAVWDEAYTVTNDGPQGLGTWLAFARAHGKPLALPEWGLRYADTPVFIKGVHDFLASCAPRPGDTDLAGKCIYDIYFNISFGGAPTFLIFGGPNQAASAQYRSLAWGS